MLGLGKDVSGMVGISWDEVGAGTFPDSSVGGNSVYRLHHWFLAYHLTSCVGIREGRVGHGWD